MTSVVPRLSTSPWAGGPRWAAEPDSVRVGVFCRDAHDLWLLGSLTESATDADRPGETSWAWESTFRTGDGFLIRLMKAANEAGPQVLVGDSPTARAVNRQKLAKTDPQDLEVLKRAVEQVEADDSATRARVAFECRLCKPRFRRVFRMEHVRPIVGRLWELGVDEISVRHLAQAIDLSRNGAT